MLPLYDGGSFGLAPLGESAKVKFDPPLAFHGLSVGICRSEREEPGSLIEASRRLIQQTRLYNEMSKSGLARSVAVISEARRVLESLKR
jgi:hypothetical protein